MCLVLSVMVKDKTADITDINNYRGITLNSVISKIFEMCLVELFINFFDSSGLQFGLKRTVWLS